MKIKTLDINGREWSDRVNGNSYHSVEVTVNFGMKNATSFIIPMTYGYGDYYKQSAFNELVKRGFIKPEDDREIEWRCYERLNITVRYSMQRNMRKKNLHK